MSLGVLPSLLSLHSPQLWLFSQMGLHHLLCFEAGGGVAPVFMAHRQTYPSLNSPPRPCTRLNTCCSLICWQHI